MKVRTRLAFSAVAVLAWLGAAPAAAGIKTPTVNAPTATPDEEKRSTIVDTDGHAYLSEDKTLKQVRAQAFANAKELALKMAESHIQTLTKVEGRKLTYHLVEVEAKGKVRVLDQKDHGIGTDKRYRVWIKAEVRFEVDEPQKKPVSDAGLAEGPLTVKVWTERKAYRAGEFMQIFLRGNRDFHGRIVYEDANGASVQVLPNAYRDKTFFRGGQTYVIPDGVDRFAFRVGAPFGRERITVYASTGALGRVKTSPIPDGRMIIRETRETIAIRTRGITPVPVGPASAGRAGAAGAEFYEAVWQVETKPSNTR